MLDNLDKIPWSSLRCLSGNASHVPAAVRNLMSTNQSEVEAAYWQLENHVVVQGELFEAAAFLPEILFEVLDAARFKGSVLELLFQIGHGHSSDNPDLQSRCHHAVVNGLERWLASAVEVEQSTRDAALEDLRTIRENARISNEMVEQK